MSTRAKVLMGLVVAICLIAWAVVLTKSYYSQAFGPDHEVLTSIQAGKSVDDVVTSLGEPTFRYERSNAPSEYYVAGYSYKRRAITGYVYIYIRNEAIGYVWFDQLGRVEEVFVGGS